MSDAVERYRRAVTLAETAVTTYIEEPGLPRFARALRRVDVALTLGLQLTGAHHTGPAIVAQLRAQYGH
ncbi:hypothetical protein [Mycolicibacterium goodii]|uniref:hypothetical protein n=1 Tax=Mycolicibacterium goodii TaxID=134601 RepID=UPI001BDD4F26|nr:hypothetical protein [Mycolicibacterium goodii]MBU8834480.1 hypothetical protein [Mycolicibacterium goodii]